MQLKKIASLALVFVLVASLFSACTPKAEPTAAPADSTAAAATDAAPASGDVKITFLNSKGEIQAQLEETALAFSAENKGITVEIVPAPAGQSPFEKISSMYASGNAPTLAMLDGGDIPKFNDKFADLSTEKWVADAAKGSLDDVTLSGQVKAFPMTVEGYGLIYNQSVLDKAVGGTFDPSTIKTRDDLEALFKQIEASGVKALVISPMDWSLGAHFLAMGYADQSSDSADINQFLADLKAGSVDLHSNAPINGLLDTFDMMMKYNIDKADPLSGTYEKDAEVLGNGTVGMWFMGNWAWPNVSQFSGEDAKFGFLPVPISNNASDYGNDSVPVGVSKFVGLDTEQNTPEQQAAAKKFLEWLVYSPTGQDKLVNTCNVIPAFGNITLPAKDPMAADLKQHLNDGKIIKFMVTLPSDHWSVTGASMQKYLSGNVDRSALLDEIAAYWSALQ